ncbi:MAG: ORF6N domain-containing protein [Elusimicrobiota bacterium]
MTIIELTAVPGKNEGTNRRGQSYVGVGFMKRETFQDVVGIERRIYLLRGQKVMLDRDLAEMYGVSTKRLNEQVKRNPKRFPADFMFQLNKKELADWRSRIATSNPGAKMGIRRLPYAFTEQGVAMLSSVLNSERAILVNVQIMRTFVRLRQMLTSNKELAHRLNKLEKKYDSQFRVVFDAIRELMAPSESPRKAIGFQLGS